MIRLTVPRYGAASEVTGLPDRAITITNSERSTAACDGRWLYAYGDGVKRASTPRPMRFGSAVHAVLEDMHDWWVEHDSPYPAVSAARTGHLQRLSTACVWCRGDQCSHCDDTGDSPIERQATEWRTSVGVDGGFEDDEDLNKEVERLRRVVEGYLFVYGVSPPSEYRIVGSEVKIALPIIAANGRPYAPTTWIVPTPTGWRIARTGEASIPDARQVRWPYYQCMTLDAVWQHRRTGGLWVYEAKTAKAPKGRADGLTLDPQISGYCLGLQSVVRRGLLPGVSKNSLVQGWIFDVLGNSYQNDPVRLTPRPVKANHPDTGEPYKVKSRWVYEKNADGTVLERSPGLSRSKTAGVASWRYRNAIAELGLNESDYSDHLLRIMTVTDPKVYVRTEGTSGPEVGQRYAVEIRAVAARLARLRRTAAALPHPAGENGVLVLAQAFPRTPVCLQPGGTCSYRDLCLNDGAMVRREYVKSDSLSWDDDELVKPQPIEEKLSW